MTSLASHRTRAPLLWALISLAAAAVLPWAQAQTATPGTLDEALSAVETRVGVVTASLELADAERALARTESDPLALRLERTQAAQAVTLARAELEQARFEARAEVAGAWARVRETARQVELAEAARDLAGRSLAVAELRFERGSATQLDVDEARTGLADAEANLASARAGLALSRADLAGLTGLPAAERLAPVDRVRVTVPLPDDEALEDAVEGLPSFLQLAHAVELAGLGVELLDPSFAAQAQIEEARTQLAQAEAGVGEARRGLRLQVRALRNAVVSARERDRLALEAYAQAQEREAIEASRFAAGLISELALDGVRLETLQVELRAIQAEHALIDALLALQAGTLRPLEGWDGR